MRDAALMTSWTPKEDERLRSLLPMCMTYQQIADDMGRTKGMIQARAKRLGLRKPRFGNTMQTMPGQRVIPMPTRLHHEDLNTISAEYLRRKLT